MGKKDSQMSSFRARTRWFFRNRSGKTPLPHLSPKERDKKKKEEPTLITQRFLATFYVYRFYILNKTAMDTGDLFKKKIPKMYTVSILKHRRRLSVGALKGVTEGI